MSNQISFVPGLQKASGRLDYPLTNDYMFRALCQKNEKYDNLSHGDSYKDVQSAVHIGILDFTLFPENPLFYSCNKLMDEKTFHIYSDKFALNVLDLSKADLATDEDKEWKLDYWARLFKATTWEDIKMIATENEYLEEASNTLYDLNADFNIRERCRNRAEYQNVLDQFQWRIEQKDIEIARQTAELERLRAEIEKLKKQNG